MNKFEEKMFDTLVDRDISNEILGYIKNLKKKAELGEHYKHLYSEVKKQKDDVVEGLKDLRQFVYDELVDFNVKGATETHCKVMNLLRMLGEIDNE